MSIRDVQQLETTLSKLALLEQQMIALKAEPVTNLRTRELSRRSLQKPINQLKEEVSRFQAQASSRN